MLKILILGLLIISPIYIYGKPADQYQKKIKEAERRLDEVLTHHYKVTEELKRAQQNVYRVYKESGKELRRRLENDKKISAKKSVKKRMKNEKK